jgi:hypothetical protein
MLLGEVGQDGGLEAEGLGDADEGGAVGEQEVDRQVGGRTLEADGIDLLAEAGSVVAKGAAVGLDGIEADRREFLELRLERQEIARAVELERYSVVAHLVSSSFVKLEGRGGGPHSDALAAVGVEQGGVVGLEPRIERLARAEGVVRADPHRNRLAADAPP